MRTEQLLEQCLLALSNGQELPMEVARYLARHPEQRAEVEDLLFIGQRMSRLPAVSMSDEARTGMQQRLASRLGVDPAAFTAPQAQADIEGGGEQMLPYSSSAGRKKLRVGRLGLAWLRYGSAEPPRDTISEARIRELFRDLTPDDIRRYIGVRGEDYLYYRQRLPGWRPVLSVLALVLRSFKRLERMMAGG